MAIAYVNSSNSGGDATVSSISWSHTVSGTNAVLIVGVSSYDPTDADRVITGVTYNSVAMTEIKHQSNDADDRSASIWYLVGPSTGSNTVEVTFTGTVLDAIGMAVVLSGVDQVTPLDGNNGANASSANSVSTTVTTAKNNSWIVDTVATDGLSENITGDGSQVDRQFVEMTPLDGAMTTLATTTPGSIGVGVSEDGVFTPDWAYAAAAFMPVQASKTYGFIT